MAGLEIQPDPTVQDPYQAKPTVGDISPDGEETATMICALSAYFRTGIDEAKRHREEIGVDARLVSCLRAFKGEYEPETLALIREKGGTEVFRKLTTAKCIDLASWLKDVLANADERPWDLEPTPIASLPDEIRQQLEGELQDDLMEQQYKLTNAVETGQISYQQYEQVRNELNSPELSMQVQQEVEDETLKRLQEEAKERIARMIKLCEDQQAEGDWDTAFADFIEDYKIYPNAFIRGPFVKNVRQLEFTSGQVRVVTKPILCWKRFSPHNAFPSPNATTPQDGAFHLREYMTRKDVYGLIGLPGYKDDSLREVLKKRQHTVTTHQIETTSDSEMSDLQGKPRPFEQKSDSPFEAFHSFDAVPGQILIDWGLNVDDPDKPYEVYVLSIDGVAVKATLNPDPLGRRQVSMDSFRRIPDSFWGESLTEAMQDVQDECNATIRNMVNNLAMSSGPLGAIDVNALAEGFELSNIGPWQLYQFDGSKLGKTARKAIEWENIPCNVQEYMLAYNDIKKEADDVTGIPAFVHGSGQTDGAGETARGLAMLMDSAAKGIRENIRCIGKRVICDSLQRQYVWNMIYHPDDSVKGDAQIKPTGPLAVIAQQQAQVELGNFLQETNNPTDQAIIGPKRRSALLRKRATTLNLDPDDVAPSEEEMDEMQQNAMDMPMSPEPGPEVRQ